MGAALIGCWPKSSIVPSNMPMQRSDWWSQWRFLEMEVLLGKDMLYRSMGSFGGRRSFPQRSCIVIEVVREAVERVSEARAGLGCSDGGRRAGQRVAAVEQQSRALHAGVIFAKSSLQDDSLPRAKHAYAGLVSRCRVVSGYG